MKNKFKIAVIVLLCFVVTGCIPKKLDNSTITEVHLFTGSAADGYSFDYNFVEDLVFYQKWENGDVVNYNLTITSEKLDEVKKILDEYKFSSKDKSVSDCDMLDSCNMEYVSVVSEGKKYYISKKEKEDAFKKLEDFFETLEKVQMETFE